MPPKIIYFDLGNVLLSFSHAQMCRQMADVAGVSPERIREVVFGTDESAVQWQYEVGQITTDEYYEGICRQIGCRPDRARLEHAACDIFEPIVATWEFVRALAAADHRLAILSNSNLLHWRFISDGRFPLLDSPGGPSSPFAWAVISFEAGSMKPDRRIYDVAIERAGVPPELIFFVDDRPENVAAARAAGIDAVEYAGTLKLIDDLHRRGVDGI
jgi:FMN phosphatase YigB (HAD superfamily)